MLTFLVCAVAGLQASAAPPPLPFMGGDVADFVATYARRYHRPVCVGTSEGRIAAFDVRARTFEELDRKIATRIGAETRGPGAFATLAYPRDFFMTGRSSAPKAPKEITSKDGEVTFESKDPLVLVLGSLSSLKWSKPFEIHWFLSPTKLVAMLGSENMAEKEFLELVANAAGGELVESKDRYFVDLPPQRHKELWASYLEGMATRQTPPPRDAARFRFGAAVVRQTPLKTLREATANPDSSSLVTLAPLDHAVDLAREYVSRELSYLAGEVSKGDSGALSKIEFFQRINWLNQVRAVSRAHGTVGCLVRLDDGALVAFWIGALGGWLALGSSQPCLESPRRRGKRGTAPYSGPDLRAELARLSAKSPRAPIESPSLEREERNEADGLMSAGRRGPTPAAEPDQTVP